MKRIFNIPGSRLNKEKPTLKKATILTGSLILAFILWFCMFSPYTSGFIEFWPTMCCSALALTGLSLAADRKWMKDCKFNFSNLIAGVATAAVLWGIFWIGDKVSSFLFSFAPAQIDSVYGMKDGSPHLVISLLLLFIIGPGEEIFWRGYVQNSLSAITGNRNTGFLLSLIFYTAIHIPSMNFMLVMAALTAGFVWGMLYRLFPDKFIALVISHALWDAAVFIWFPIQ